MGMSKVPSRTLRVKSKVVNHGQNLQRCCTVEYLNGMERQNKEL